MLSSVLTNLKLKTRYFFGGGKYKFMFKSFFIAISFLFICINQVYLFSNVYYLRKENLEIQQLIRIHSIHPTFGNYKKQNLLGAACHPWDRCEP